LDKENPADFVQTRSISKLSKLVVEAVIEAVGNSPSQLLRK
jgi:hypothetical protein